MKRKLSQYQLEEIDMNEVNKGASSGWRYCGCGCCYAEIGGSSISANYSANIRGGDHGLTSEECLWKEWIYLD